MKKLLGLALAGALSVAALPAVAADYPVKAPPPPIWTWSGFYVGVNAGAGWDHTRFDAFTPAGVFLSTTGDIQGSGGVLGGTLGWNWQAPGSPWVLGIEGDFDWTNLRTTALCLTCYTRVNWLATIRGRVGHANGPLLFYLTGGVAFAGERNFQPTNFDFTDTVTGWAAGGGLEGALGGNWSLKAEYIYAAFGPSSRAPLAFSPPNVTEAHYLRIHVLRAGVNYKF
jgi:outer membrane immunogenic protein